MKKTLLLAAFAAAMLSCAKEVNTPQPETAPTRPILFNAASPETKTVFGTPEGSTYPVLWTADDEKVALTLNLSDDFSSVNITPSVDRKKASFSGEFTTDAPSYTFVAVAPANALRSANATNKTVNVEIPSAQTSTSTSPDGAAQILCAASSTYATFPTEEVEMTFKHVTGYFHLVFTDYATAMGTATVQSVSLSSETQTLAGRIFYHPEDGHTTDNSPAKTVTVNTTTLDNVWVALAPVDLSGKTLTVTVNTDQGTITKDLTFPADRELKSGKIAKFQISLDGKTIKAPVQYNLVTNENQLHVGDQIIVVAANYDVALSASQNSNNRGQAGITKGDGVILDPSDAVEVITLEDGKIPGEYALKATKTEGYLFADGGSSSNYLRTKATLDNTGSWHIAIKQNQTNAIMADEPVTDNVAEVITDACTHGVLRYNFTNTIFSAYLSTSKVYFIHLYRLNQDPDDSPRFKATMPEADGENNCAISASAQNLAVYVFGNSAWTAAVSGTGASLDATSGTGNAILELSIPENASTTETKSYTVSISTSASVTPASYSFTITQAKAIDAGGTPEKVYEVLPTPNTEAGEAVGTNNTFAGNCDMTRNGIVWNMTGNASNTAEWRFGGKSLSGVDRAMYSKTAIPHEVTKVIVNHGAISNGSKSSMTVNSLTLSVYATAADAAANTDAIATLTQSSIAANSTITFNKADETSWAGCYYRLTYNVTCTGSNNCHIKFLGAEFWGFPSE